MLVGAEIAGSWLLASLFDLAPSYAFVATVVVLATLIAMLRLLTERPRRD